MIFPLHAGFEPTLPRWLGAGWKGSASTGERTRAVCVTGEDSTTEPPMQTHTIHENYANKTHAIRQVQIY